jgi:hypothetical protein
MDDETRTFLRGAYEYILQHEAAMQQVMIVTFALRKTVRELGPTAEELYAKHYAVESQGPLKTESDAVQQSLSRLIALLMPLN